MKLYVNKLFLILAFIPILLIFIFIFNKDININNSFKSLLKFIIKDQKNHFNSSNIIKICNLENNTHLLLLNNTNNFELIKLYANLTIKNITNIINDFDTHKLNYDIIKIPYLNLSINNTKPFYQLQSGLYLNLSLQKNTKSKKYRTFFSVYNSTNESIICSNHFYFTKIIKYFIITCFEQIPNEIFCPYISEQNPNDYITKLNITHFSFDGNNLIKQSDTFLKTFNYKIRNIQSLKISQKETSLIIYKDNYEIEFYLLKNFFEEEIKFKKCDNFNRKFEHNRYMLNMSEKREAFKIFEKGHKIYIEGHRGDTTIYQDNTLLSFKEAIKNKLDSIELDVWLTKDKIPIVFHGEKNGIFAKRVIDNKVVENFRVNNFTYDSIKRINEKYKGKEIPKLEEVLDLCKNNIFINIELKDYQYELTFNIVIDLITKKNMFDQIALSSTKNKYLQLIYHNNINNNIKIECGHILRIFSKTKDIINIYGCSMNIRAFEINEDIVKEAHKNGLPVMAYFLKEDNENDEIYKKLIDFNIDVICCNFPNKALKFRNKYFYEKYIQKGE